MAVAKLDRDGVAIHYEVHGQGPAILLSHGYSATCRMWDGQIAALRDRYQVIVWDMRGHGAKRLSGLIRQLIRRPPPSRIWPPFCTPAAFSAR